MSAVSTRAPGSLPAIAAGSRMGNTREPEEETEMAKTAREVMSENCECIGESDVGDRGREEDVRARRRRAADLRRRRPPQGNAHRPRHRGKGARAGKGPDSTKAGEFGEGKPVTIGADDSIEDAIATMKEHKVRRLPVIDGHELVGIVSQGDLARNDGRGGGRRAGRDDLGGRVAATKAHVPGPWMASGARTGADIHDVGPMSLETRGAALRGARLPLHAELRRCRRPRLLPRRPRRRDRVRDRGLRHPRRPGPAQRRRAAAAGRRSPGG